jgi:transposase
MNCSEFFNPRERTSDRAFARRVVVALCEERAMSNSEIQKGLCVSRSTLRDDRRAIESWRENNTEFREVLSLARAQLAQIIT